MRLPFVALLLLALLTPFVTPGSSWAEEEGTSLEQLVVEMAHTKAEHQALANYFEREAQDARKLASRHRSMGRAYLGGKFMNKQAFKNHCNRIAEQQEAIAKEYEALAKMHEEEANKATE
jgi:hypothetical protein